MPNTIKELKIIDAKDTSVGYNVENIDNPDRFYEILKNYNIDDLSKVTIQKNNDKYIFWIKWHWDVLAVNGELDFKAFIADFYEREKNYEESFVVELNNLKLTVLSGNTTSITDTADRQKEHYELSYDMENVKWRVKILKDFFEAQSDDASWNAFFLNRNFTREEKSAFRIQRSQADNSLKTLKNIEDQIEEFEKWAYNDARLTEFDKKESLKKFSAKLDQLSNNVPEFIAYRNDILLQNPDTIPYYPININTKEEARTVKKALERSNSYIQKLNKIENKTAKQQELAQDLKALEEYLNDVIAGKIDPAKKPFEAKHLKAFNYLMTIDPTLKTQFVDKKWVTWAGDNGGTGGSGAGDTANEAGGDSTNKDKKENPADPTTWWGAFEKGGIAAMWDKTLEATNMTASQKQTWKWVGNIVATAGLVFVGWKMLSSAFSLLSKEGRTGDKLASNLKWLGIPAALMFASQAYSGGSLLDILKGGPLTEKLGGLFGLGRSPETQVYGEWFTWVTALFAGKKYGEMAPVLDKNADGKTVIKESEYDTLIASLKNGNDQQKVGAKFLENIGKEDKNGLLDMALGAMGVSYEQITDPANEKTEFSKAASEAIVRVGQVSEFMDKWGYDTISKENTNLVKDYISKWTPTLEELEARQDIFEKKGELPSQEIQDVITTKVDAFDIPDEKKGTLKDALKRFTYLWPTDEATKKNFDITAKSADEFSFTTYDKAININLNTKKIEKLDKINFASTTELLKAANLTNRIKLICKDKPTSSETPFKLSTPGKDIEFDDASIFSTSFDTEIVTAGGNGKLNTISSKLEANKQDYVDYLNLLWKNGEMK